MIANTKYKDTVFTTLFNNPDLLRELYCALEGITLPPDTPISINTLERALLMGMYNDISFTIGGKLVVLIEHQSTISPNMPLRLLMYLSAIYQKMTKEKDIYSEKPLSIPRPKFFVLYNGHAPYPDNVVLRLSKLYEDTEDLGIPKEEYSSTDLEVRIININEGRNAEIVKRCSKLREYSALVAKINEYKEETGNLDIAIEKAIKYCHKYDILKEYLEKYASEVLNMLYTEFNIDVAKEVWQEEAREKAHEEVFELLAQDSQKKKSKKLSNI
ncbi:MAG: Rpn family recombination-promoting nuclease/putative transposase [Spirochaetaceae bacterium]|nr:Rpn family recombination-promoting nuclease/putative transposase [Spirochaetaceae bacterium]